MVGLTRISFTLTWLGASIAKIIAFEISSAFNPSISLCFSTNASKAFSVIVLVNSVCTTPGSILVIRIFFRTESSCLSPSENAVTACFVAQIYTSCWENNSSRY